MDSGARLTTMHRRMQQKDCRRTVSSMKIGLCQSRPAMGNLAKYPFLEIHQNCCTTSSTKVSKTTKGFIFIFLKEPDSQRYGLYSTIVNAELRGCRLDRVNCHESCGLAKDPLSATVSYQYQWRPVPVIFASDCRSPGKD